MTSCTKAFTVAQYIAEPIPVISVMGVEMPELHVSVPRDVRGCQYGDAARQVQQHAEIAAIQAVNEDSAEKGNQQTGQSYYDYLEADFYGGMGGGEDVPADADEVHSAAEERDEHGEEEKAEAALGA